jgi:hypothetical protein
MKKFFFILGAVLLLFVFDQRTYAHLFVYTLVGVGVLAVCAAVAVCVVAFDHWYQKHVYTSIQEWRERDRERTRNLRRYHHINRLR